jgi:hypothetical protein
MILAYSVALPGPVRIPEHIQSLKVSDCQCFFSEANKELLENAPNEEAVRFFQANRRLFSQISIIEFRFPTILKDEAELKEFLHSNQQKIASELTRLRGFAQITVYLSGGEESPVVSVQSGTEYLQSKREASQKREVLRSEILGIAGDRVSEALEQGERLHLLVRQDSARSLIDELDRSRFRVAGPFPPSSFAKLLF